MITTMNEIEQRFDAIKDHKPKASKKLNELGEILASAYKINPDRADEMWQYLVELNVRDDEKNAKFYIAQVFNKVKGLIPADEATDLIMMTPERVEMMLLYGYDGGTLYSVLNTLTIGFLKNENVNNVMACLEYVFEKFGGVELNNPEILKATKTIVQTGAELLQTDKDYEPIVCELLNEIESFNNEKIVAYAKVNSLLLGLSTTNNIEDLLQLASEFNFTQEFMDLLWLAREDISMKKLEAIWQNFVENIEENNLLPMPEEYEEEELVEAREDFYRKFRVYEDLLRSFLANEVYSDLLTPEGDLEDALVHMQWIGMEYATIRQAVFQWQKDGRGSLPYETLRDYMVVISRMTGYEEEDIREYLENSFEELLWEWGYFALITGK